MAGVKLTQEMVDQLVAKLSFYKYQVAFGETILGPLNSPPKIDPDTETKDTVLYETGVDPLANILSKNNANITIETNDVDAALTMLREFKKGDNLLDSSKAKPLTFVPLTEDANAKAITFPNCYLQPGLAPNFAEGDDPNYVSLSFVAKPVVETNELYTYE